MLLVTFLGTKRKEPERAALNEKYEEYCCSHSPFTTSFLTQLEHRAKNVLLQAYFRLSDSRFSLAHVIKEFRITHSSLVIAFKGEYLYFFMQKPYKYARFRIFTAKFSVFRILTFQRTAMYTIGSEV